MHELLYHFACIGRCPPLGTVEQVRKLTLWLMSVFGFIACKVLFMACFGRCVPLGRTVSAIIFEALN